MRFLCMTIQCIDTRRIGRIIHNEDNPDCDLHILEVGTSVPRVHPSSKKGSLFWPDGAPPVDGVIICYDASSRLSFGPVEELLRGCACYILCAVSHDR